MAEALASAGADLLMVETHNTRREARAAALAALATGLPVVVSFVCGPDAALLSGERLDEAAAEARDLGAIAVLAKVERIRMLLEDPGSGRIPATEVLRRAVEWGFSGGRSQMTELVKRLRPRPRQEPIVRFDGLPGEYTQFDFGECDVEFTSTGKQRVQFFPARLKYSRYAHVVIVPDQTAETLVRSLIACLVAFGGSTKEWVFDNPRTVRISPIGVKPVVLHRLLRQLVAEYNVIATLCAPRSGNQKAYVAHCLPSDPTGAGSRIRAFGPRSFQTNFFGASVPGIS